MKLLVTGGAGYIGSHFCKTAAAEGHEVITYDNLSTGHKDFVKWGEFIEGELSDSKKIQDVLTSQNIDAVVHFAAKAIIAESNKHPDMYYENNVEGTRSLLWAMSMAGTDKILFSSSCTTYGITDEAFISEDHIQAPINPYGDTKKACEEMVIDFQDSFPGKEAGILRYFNVVGCDPEGELWEWHDPETHIVPNMIRAGLENRPVMIFGDDYDTRDGTCVRDFIDVNDLAKIHLKALDQLNTENVFISNIGLGRGYSLYDLKTIIEDVLELKVKHEVVGRRQGDPPRLVADCQFFKSWYSEELSDLKASLKNIKDTGLAEKFLPVELR